jgi:hypothetical protein
MNVHLKTELYFCSVDGCGRARGKGFRDDNCRRHLISVHGFSAEEARECVREQEREKRGRR